MHSPTRRVSASVTVFAALFAAGLAPAARAQTFTITFEDASNVPSNGTLLAPSLLDAASSLAAAYGGTDTSATATIQGVTFINRFTVFRNTYTNAVLGNDLYGPTSGALALANIVNPPGPGATPPDTGPGNAGPDGLTFSTTFVLTGLSAATVDYGDGSPGAAHLTITPLGASGALGPGITTTLNSTLTPVDTSAFLVYAGHITGYRLNRDLGTSGYAALQGGGNYALDNLSFTSAPEPSAFLGLAFGALGLAGLGVKARRRA